MEGFGSKEFLFGVRVFGVDEICGVNLDFVYVNVVIVNGYDYFLIVISGVSVVGGGEVKSIGMVLFEERVFVKVCSVVISG